MIDIQLLRDNPELIQQKAAEKGYQIDVNEILTLDEKRRNLQQEIDVLRTERNQVAEAVKQSSRRPDQELIDKGKKIKQQLSDIEDQQRSINESFLTLLKAVPNMPSDDVPVGASEDENRVSKTVGDIPVFDFEPKNHAEIAANKGWLDKERAAKVSGSRFAYIMGDMVKLQLAIEHFVIDTLSDEAKIAEIARGAGLDDIDTRPFIPVLPPLMIKTDLYDAMDRLEPSDDRYKIDGEELWLQGSAEHVLGSMHAGEIFEQEQLPLRYIGLATSFRKEAGTYGKDMEGIIRMHQFDKLEMESFTTAQDSFKEHLFFVAIQEWLLSALGIPYQVIQKCTADIGKPDARGIDMEAWLPGQQKYRETHTADYMTDYQSRRLQTRVRTSDGVELVHTNDATAFALGRIMVAVIENYQTSEGDVTIPKVLRPYMQNREMI